MQQSNKICGTCGFRIRGKDHDNGPHHKRLSSHFGKSILRMQDARERLGQATNIGDPQQSWAWNTFSPAYLSSVLGFSRPRIAK